MVAGLKVTRLSSCNPLLIEHIFNCLGLDYRIDDSYTSALSYSEIFPLMEIDDFMNRISSPDYSIIESPYAEAAGSPSGFALQTTSYELQSYRLVLNNTSSAIKLAMRILWPTA